ncbi:MAG: molybdopterin-dependent oxidoreductase [Myxococcales bacterium]|nr:molybdopterin-dependent oxidoreductase [Myxococcales bacterium]MDD9967548.1 molybdopterin-dependent oxidoreductase [Myxococcales bacterium]
MRPLLTRRVFVRSLAGAAASPWVACRAQVGEDREERVVDPGLGLDEQVLCQSFLTPVEDFYRQFGAKSTVDGWQQPDLSADATIAIDGLVAQPLSLRLEDLEADQDAHVTVLNTLMCIFGPRSTAIFTGIPLRVLLARAGIDRTRARRLRLYGADGFENNLRVSDVFDNPPDLFEPLLAFRIAGEPLPKTLGYPVRLLLNDRYGYKNVKWLARIEATDDDRPSGQYQMRGYPDAGVIEPVPVVETHRVTQTIPVGATQLCGFALSGYAPIEVVELSLDGGPPEQLEGSPLEALIREHPGLSETRQVAEPARFGFPLRGVWVRWQYVFDARPGEHRIEVRTRDGAGNLGEATALRLIAG